MRCLIEMARRLAHGGDSLAATFSATAELAKGCDSSTLSMLLGLLAAGCGPTGAPRVALVSPAAAVKALDSLANHGSFEWVVERYSLLPAGVGEPSYSPYFRAAGVDWRFKVYPGGQESAGRFSGECCQPRRRASVGAHLDALEGAKLAAFARVEQPGMQLSCRLAGILTKFRNGRPLSCTQCSLSPPHRATSPPPAS